MTVSSTTNKISYVAGPSNATTAWTFPFPGVAASDLTLYSTDASGNITTVSSSLYSVVLNAPIAPNPTGIGGTINYPLTGPPVTSVTLTILRTLPLTQATSLANQGTLYQTVIESELDNLLMQVQQVNELLGRQITVAVSDPTPAPLPPAAQRANQYCAFDGSGNPIAASATPDTVPVSSAMQPVVAAATIADALTLLGLSGLVPEPSGVIKAFAGSSVPTGYLLCYGQAVSRTTYAALFTAIGTAYGVGDGTTTFNLPDLRGRIIAGLDNMGGVAAGLLTSTTITGGATTLGNIGGAQTHALTTPELAVHSHAITDPGHVHSYGEPQSGAGVAGGTGAGLVPTNTDSATTGITATNNSGSGTAHVNVQPTMVMNWIIKT